MNKFLKIFAVIFPFHLCGCNNDDDPIPVSPDDHIPVSPDLGRMNLDFEDRSPGNASLPKIWNIWGDGFTTSLDDVEKYGGMLSLKMERKGNPNGAFGVFSNTLPIETFAGKNVEYKGWIKTKGVKNGHAGLWLRVDGEDNMISLDNMYDRGLKGDNKWTQVSIQMNVSNDAKAIIFGGLFPGEGVVWFDHLELFINGEKYIDPEPKTSLSQDEITVLKKYIYPLRTYEPDGGDTKDLKVLDDLIGNSKVVALGENTHGSSEIFKMKNRIIQYLAANNGFDIFSMEANMPESYKLNDYTVRGEGDPKGLIAGTWRTEEVLNMVEWMRRFNQPNQRILFTGFDMQFPAGAINELSGAFKGNIEVETKINDLKNKLDVNTNYWSDLSAVEIDEINILLKFIKNNIETSSFQDSEKNWLLQNILIIQQSLEYKSSNYADACRDKCMADNFMWIKEHNPDSKFVIWAHNMHIAKEVGYQGYYLAERLGDEYKTFGFTFPEGRYTAIGSKGLTTYEAIKAYPGTLEYLLNQLNEPIFILDLKKIKSDNHKDTKWLTERLPYRIVGGRGGQPTEFYDRKIIDDFDYLIFIKTSSPSTLFYIQ